MTARHAGDGNIQVAACPVVVCRIVAPLVCQLPFWLPLGVGPHDTVAPLQRPCWPGVVLAKPQGQLGVPCQDVVFRYVLCGVARVWNGREMQQPVWWNWGVANLPMLVATEGGGQSHGIFWAVHLHGWWNIVPISPVDKGGCGYGGADTGGGSSVARESKVGNREGVLTIRVLMLRCLEDGRGSKALALRVVPSSPDGLANVSGTTPSWSREPTRCARLSLLPSAVRGWSAVKCRAPSGGESCGGYSPARAACCAQMNLAKPLSVGDAHRWGVRHGVSITSEGGEGL